MTMLLLLVAINVYAPNRVTYITIKEEKVVTYDALVEKFYAYFRQSDLTKPQFKELITYANNSPLGDTLLATIARESSFVSTAIGKGNDYGLAQFVEVACLYHELEHDSMFNPLYALKACEIRYNDIKESKGYVGNEMINAYGAYYKAYDGDSTRAVMKFNKYLKIIKKFKYKVKNYCL